MIHPFQRLKAWLCGADDPVVQQWETETVISRKKTTRIRTQIDAGDPISAAYRGHRRPTAPVKKQRPS